MRGVVFNSYEKKDENGEFRLKFFNFIISPVKYGIAGFSFFFSVLILLKLLFYLPGYRNYFDVNIMDIKLSMIGFGVVSFVRFIENFRKNR